MDLKYSSDPETTVRALLENERETEDQLMANYSDFEMYWDVLQDQIYATACEKGWWDEDRNDGELIALMHSELSEALEVLRKNPEQESEKIDRMAIEEELADVVIRIMDFAAARDYDVSGAVVSKHKYNQTRERKHGKRF